MSGGQSVLPAIFELHVVGVLAPGVPNEERIYLRAVFEVNLGEYLLFTGWRVTDELAIPMTGDLFWFGNARVDAGTWIVVYTGPGEAKVTTMTSGEPAIVLHWNKPHTVFNRPEVVPVLVHVDAVKVGQQIWGAGQSRGASGSGSSP